MKKPENNEKNDNRCICPNCPLFNDCAEDKKERAFCSKTISSCIKENTGPCICGGCPLYLENNLAGGYFCLKEIIINNN